jgi:hypothetical protein
MTHTRLRQAAITAALKARAHLRGVQDSPARRPPSTVRYDRHRHSVDRHATASPRTWPAPTSSDSGRDANVLGDKGGAAGLHRVDLEAHRFEVSKSSGLRV